MPPQLTLFLYLNSFGTMLMTNAQCVCMLCIFALFINISRTFDVNSETPSHSPSLLGSNKCLHIWNTTVSFTVFVY